MAVRSGLGRRIIEFGYGIAECCLQPRSRFRFRANRSRDEHAQCRRSSQLLHVMRLIITNSTTPAASLVD